MTTLTALALTPLHAGDIDEEDYRVRRAVLREKE